MYLSIPTHIHRSVAYSIHVMAALIWTTRSVFELTRESRFPQLALVCALNPPLRSPAAWGGLEHRRVPAQCFKEETHRNPLSILVTQSRLSYP